MRWRTAARAAVLTVAMLFSAIAPTGLTSVAPRRARGQGLRKPAIVILGYGLTPQGAMRPILYTRVLTGLAVAQIFPQSPIIVTGGNPRNGRD